MEKTVDLSCQLCDSGWGYLDGVEKESEVNSPPRECCNQLIRPGIGSGQGKHHTHARFWPFQARGKCEKEKNPSLFSSEITLRSLD